MFLFEGSREGDGVHRFQARHGVTLDAGDLHEPRNGVAGQTEVVFEGDFRRAFHPFRV